MATPCCEKIKPENAARNFPNPARILFNSRVLHIFKQKPDAKILEIGGGCLRNALYLQRQGYAVSVMEVPQMRARFPEQYSTFEKSGGRLIKGLSKRYYSIAICTFVIETICDSRERSTVLKSVASSLHQDGCLILSARGPRDLVTATAKGVPCSDGFITPNLSFARSYTRNQLTRLLLGSGFRRLDFLHKKSSVEPELLHVIAWIR